MKKNKILKTIQIIISFLFCFYVFLFIISAKICPDNNEIDLSIVSCEAITPAGTNCSINVTIIYLNNQSINYSVEMNQKFAINNTCNFSFIYTNKGDWYLKIIDINNQIVTSIVQVGNLAEDYNDKWLYFYGFALGIGVLLFMYGYKIENYIFTLIAGFLFLAFAITFITQGYPLLTNYTIRISIILLSSAIGLYLTGNSAIGLIREGLG